MAELIVSGQRFGRLTVVEFQRDRRGRPAWRCRCDCGGEAGPAPEGKLRSNHTQSCGCLQKERAREANTTHGLGKPPEYRVWTTMIRRCTDPKNAVYDRYGGRGITVCDRWRYDFAAFYADMGSRPTAVHTLDRIDNAKGYFPGNCRWATAKEQCRNRRSNRLLTHNGETLPLIVWSERTGIPGWTILARLKAGRTMQEALTLPVRFMSPRKRTAT